MSKIFISYSRENAEAVYSFADGIKKVGHEVWIDQDLIGGQLWWDQILENIQNTDFFIFAVSLKALESVACQREYEYAAALKKPVLPVLVAEGVSTHLLPLDLLNIQLVDYRVRDQDALLSLLKAIGTPPNPVPLPDPLPLAPELPKSKMTELAQRVSEVSELDLSTQSVLLSDIESILGGSETRSDGLLLLKIFKKREDCLAKISTKIDSLIYNHTVSEVGVHSEPSFEPHTPLPSTLSPASYWVEHECIVQDVIQNVRRNLSYHPKQPLGYLRIWPQSKIPSLGGAVLENQAIIKPLQYQRGGAHNRQNKYGCICFCLEENNITSSTQVFTNGEIWGIDSTLIGSMETEEGKILTVKPKQFQICIQRSIKEYFEAALGVFDYPNNIQIMAGITQISSSHYLYIDDDSDYYIRQIYDDICHQQCIDATKPDEINDFMLKLFTMLFDVARYGRPVNFGGFPEMKD